MSGRILLLVFLVAFSGPATASADWLVSPYVGVRFAADTTLLVGFEGAEENTFTFGSSIGFLTDGILGVEADVAFIPGFFESPLTRSSRVTTVMGNVIVAAPLGVTQYGLRPYVVGGAGLMRAGASSVDPNIDDPIGSNLFGMNVGGGALGPISPRSYVRFDLRYFRNLSDDAEAITFSGARVKLSYWRATVGLTFRF